MVSRHSVVRKAFEPFLVGVEPLAALFKGHRLVVFYAHLYPNGQGHFDSDSIRQILHYLSEKCHALPLVDALNQLEKGIELPPRAVSLIVDDATQNFYEYGHGLLSDAGLPYTLAVIPGLIKDKSKEHLLSRLMRIGGHTYWMARDKMLQRALGWFVDSVDPGASTFDTLFQKASDLSKKDLRELLDHMRALDHNFMTWEELRDVQAQDQVHFASHTMSHPKLRFASGKWLAWELNRSRELLEKKLDVNVQSLVAPYGHPDQYTPEVQQSLIKSGYQYAFFTQKGTVGQDTLRYRMPRMPLEDETWRLRIHTCPSVCSVLYPNLKGDNYILGRSLEI